MTDRPILFSGAMVRALIEGRKTQTRRALKVLNASMLDAAELDGGACLLPLARFQKGDRLWVRESWLKPFANTDTGSKAEMAGYIYRADGPEYLSLAEQKHQWGKEAKWKVSIHMPREASRLTLPVSDVRVQRLSEITEDDARAEGFEAGQLNDGFGPRDIGGGYTVESPGTYASAVGMFQLTWQELHPEWDGYSDPWVVALTFSVERRNIDA